MTAPGESAWQTTTMRIERSEVVHGDPGQLWSLLSSPEAFSLWPQPTFMFSVPEASERLRVFIGPTRRGPGTALFEICDEVPGSMLRLRSLPAGYQEFTLSVATGRRGTAKASVKVTEVVPRRQEIGFELKRRKDIEGWLSAVRAVAEGRRPGPGVGLPAALRDACLAQPPMNDPHDTSASAVIGADPATVWDAVHSPETARALGSSPALYSGYVPGSPPGEAGEMQYFVSRRDDGQLTGSAVVVTETSWQRSAVAQSLGPFPLAQRFLLTPESESGPTRLEVSYAWPAPKLAEDADPVRSYMAESARTLVSSYKSLIESAGRQR